MIALKTEFKKIGVTAETYSTGNLIPELEIMAGQVASSTELPISTYSDHRMAMTFAPLAIQIGKIKIEDPDVVTKSYPGFWDDLVSLGYEIVH